MGIINRNPTDETNTLKILNRIFGSNWNWQIKKKKNVIFTITFDRYFSLNIFQFNWIFIVWSKKSLNKIFQLKLLLTSRYEKYLIKIYQTQ